MSCTRTSNIVLCQNIVYPNNNMHKNGKKDETFSSLIEGAEFMSVRNLSGGSQGNDQKNVYSCNVYVVIVLLYNFCFFELCILT